MMDKSTELLEGYVVDLACVRAYPESEVLERAKQHTRSCALEGHCVESGYGFVDESGRVVVLDPEATPQIVIAVRNSQQEQGIRLRVQRAPKGGRMKTSSVEEIKS